MEWNPLAYSDAMEYLGMSKHNSDFYPAAALPSSILGAIAS